MLRRANGSMLLYYGNQTAATGSVISVARVTKISRWARRRAWTTKLRHSANILLRPTMMRCDSNSLAKEGCYTNLSARSV